MGGGCGWQGATGSIGVAAEEKFDALHDQDFSQFTLTGKYLVPPRRGTAPPALVVKSKEGKHGHGAVTTEPSQAFSRICQASFAISYRGSGEPFAVQCKWASHSRGPAEGPRAHLSILREGDGQFPPYTPPPWFQLPMV